MWTERAGLLGALLALGTAPAIAQDALPPEPGSGEAPTPAGAPVDPTPPPPPAALPVVVPPTPAPAPQPTVDKDRISDLEVSLTSYYQKVLGRAHPDTQAYQDAFPWWALFFGVLPIPVLPAEGEYVATAVQDAMEEGRFQVLPVEADVAGTGQAVAGHLEAVALTRAQVEAAQEGRYDPDAKSLAVYAHHLAAIRDAGYVYRMRLTRLSTLTDQRLSRWVAFAECEVELYQVVLPAGEGPSSLRSLGTLRVSGAGVALNVLQILDSTSDPDQTSRAVDPLAEALARTPGLASALVEALPADPLAPLGAGPTLVGALGARGIAMARAVRSLIDYLGVELSRVEGFRLEAPVDAVDGRRLQVPLGSFEGLRLDHAFGVWVVAPQGEGACPEALPRAPAPGVCGRRVGYARARTIADNRDPDGGRRTPAREEVEVITGASDAADLRPFDSDLQVLTRRGMPEGALGLKVYEERLSGHELAVSTGAMVGAGGVSGRLDLTLRRGVSDTLGIPESTFDTRVSLQAGATPLALGMVGLSKRAYVGRLGVHLGGRVGLAWLPVDCAQCRGVAAEGEAGLRLFLTPHLSLEAAALARQVANLDEAGRTHPEVGGSGAISLGW